MPVTTFDMLATSDRDLFTVCKPSLLDSVCKDGDIVAREDCLESRGAAYGQLHSPRMRRSWLIVNGCPEATVDAPPKPEALASATEAPPPTSTKSEAPPPTSTKSEAPPPPPAVAAVDSPAPPPKPDPPPPATALAAVESSPPPARLDPPAPATDQPPPAAKPEPPPPAMAVAAVDPPPPPLAKSSLPAPAPVAPRAPPAAAVAAFSERERGELRERRLRDIIVAHGREMKSCVERQLKLMPDLRADGMLVIDVDANGAVPHAELLGADLAGTPLESCLRTVASRWRFPSSGRAYRIDAPVKVSGSGR
jgi:hypothetical protein